jgi:hypothetical protein
VKLVLLNWSDNMDRRVVLALVMLAVWAVGTLRNWSGWIHALLTGGVFLLIYGIVKRSDRETGNGQRIT